MSIARTGGSGRAQKTGSSKPNMGTSRVMVNPLLPRANVATTRNNLMDFKEGQVPSDEMGLTGFYGAKPAGGR